MALWVATEYGPFWSVSAVLNLQPAVSKLVSVASWKLQVVSSAINTYLPNTYLTTRHYLFNFVAEQPPRPKNLLFAANKFRPISPHQLSARSIMNGNQFQSMMGQPPTAVNGVSTKDRGRFINLIVGSIAKMQGPNFSDAKTRPIAQEFEKYAFHNSGSKTQYVEFLKDKIASITKAKKDAMDRQRQAQAVQQAQQQQQQQQQHKYVSPQQQYANLQYQSPTIGGQQMFQQSSQTQQQQQQQQQQMQMQRQQSQQRQQQQYPQSAAMAPTGSMQGAPMSQQAQQAQQAQQQQKLLMKNAPIPQPLLDRLPQVFPKNLKTWDQIMPYFRTQNLTKKDLNTIKEVYGMHIRLVKARRMARQRQQAEAQPRSVPQQYRAPQAQRSMPKAPPSPQQILLMQQQPQHMPVSQAQPSQVPPPTQQQPAPQQRPNVNMQQLQMYKQQALQTIKHMQASGKLPNNLTPQQESAYAKKYLYHVLSNKQKQQQIQQQQQQKQQGLPAARQQMQQQLAYQQSQQQRKRAPAVAPQPAPQQLPTNQNQWYGQGQASQRTPYQAGEPMRAAEKQELLAPRLFNGVHATPDDWNRLKSIYQETSAAPIDLQDVTDELSESDKQAILRMMRQCQQLLMITQTVIVPNFYMLTHSYDGTKKLIYSELMLRQILDKLKTSGRFYTTVDLLTKIQNQITRFLTYVKEQHNKLVKSQQKQQQPIMQQQPQHMAGQDGRVMNSQPYWQQRQQLQPMSQDVSTVGQQRPLRDPYEQVDPAAVQQQFQRLAQQRQTSQLVVPQPASHVSTGSQYVAQQGSTSPILPSLVAAQHAPVQTTRRTATRRRQSRSSTTRTGRPTVSPGASKVATPLTQEAQLLLKENTELVSKQISSMTRIDQERMHRRELATQDAAKFFLATLADTLSLPEEEQKLIHKNLAMHRQTNSGSTVTSRNSKVLTPSAVLATPLPFNVKTPGSNKMYTTTSGVPGGLKESKWTGKVRSTCLAEAFDGLIPEVPREMEKKRRAGAELASLIYPTPPDEPRKKRKVCEVKPEPLETDAFWDFDKLQV